MKGTHFAPIVKVMELKTNQLQMTNGVTSDNGIDFGDIDEGSTLDPSAPGMSGLPSFVFQ